MGDRVRATCTQYASSVQRVQIRKSKPRDDVGPCTPRSYPSPRSRAEESTTIKKPRQLRKNPRPTPSGRESETVCHASTADRLRQFPRPHHHNPTRKRGSCVTPFQCCRLSRPIVAYASGYDDTHCRRSSPAREKCGLVVESGVVQLTVRRFLGKLARSGKDDCTPLGG